MKTKICVPICERRQGVAILKAKKAIKQGASLVEIWLDCLNNLDLTALFREISCPVIAVCKARNEGGTFDGSARARVDLLAEAAQLGARYIDLDLETAKKIRSQLRKHRRKLIVSYHNYEKTPPLSVLEIKVKEALKAGAAIVKIATHINRIEDNAVLFEVLQRAVKRGTKIIVIGMGEKGTISRTAAPFLGSYLTFVALDERSSTAPGQLTIGAFKKFLKQYAG